MAKRKMYRVAVADPDQVKEFAESLSEQFLQCRELGHIWKPHTANLGDGGRYYDRTLRCPRCLTRRVETLSLTGMVLSRSMVYPDGYLTPHIGRVVGEGRDTLRLESLTRFITTHSGKAAPAKTKLRSVS